MPEYLSIKEWQPSVKMEEDPLKIIKETQKNVSVLAGPGAGKTELLAQRANFLLQTLTCEAPQKILALSFKVDAAKNIEDRVKLRCGKELVRRFHSSTFDAFFSSIVRRFSSLLPDWIKISSDFDLDSFGRNYWDDYSRIKLGGKFFKGYRNPSEHPNVYIPDDLSSKPSDSELLDFWEYCAENNTIDYKMCQALAHEIVKNNKNVRNLILSTYKYLFLDEFQDATSMQYNFLKTIFKDSDTVITAVGDVNQMIMLWAGADARNFINLNEEFNSETIPLAYNHRSNFRIVKLINYIIKRLTPEGHKPIIYKGTRNEDASDDCIGCKSFSSAELEADYIAKYINIICKTETDLSPNDFVLILRQMAQNYFDVANPFFEQAGLILRNEDALATKNGIKIQDLMSEPLSNLLILLMKFKLAIISYNEEKDLEAIISSLEGYDLNNERDYRKLKISIENLISYIELSSISISDITTNILKHIGANKLRSVFRQYRLSYLKKVKESFCVLFEESFEKSSKDIRKAIEIYEGKNQVKLMTIHKSKGLEFNTVFFVNFDDEAWWAISKAVKEGDVIAQWGEKNSFFVGLSRAEERLFFTSNTGRWPEVITPLLRESELLVNMPDIE